MDNLDYVLHVADPIHGLIGITKIERQIIDSPAFQRLRCIKQLGNVHLLFPGAVHTRFAHSVGVMHTSSLIFSALLKKSTKEFHSGNYLEALKNVHQTVRLAGLLHDVGHGPLSHHFEECLRKYDGSSKTFPRLKFSEWSGDLKIREKWIRYSSLDNFKAHDLEHEHFSFGIIDRLGQDFMFDAQGVCSLLSNDIECSKILDDNLKVLAAPFSDRANYSQKLKVVLKSILSGDIDADRLDYLRRDSYYCGTSIAAIDMNHLLASANLSYKEGNFFIEISRNAIPVVENILISRKQMFNQIYNHRVNGAFDYLMSRSIDFLILSKSILIPGNYVEFLPLTDDFLEKSMTRMVTDSNIPSNKIFMNPQSRMEFEELAVICAKFYATRTPLVRLLEEDVFEENASGRVFELQNQYGPEALVLPINLKSFYKRSQSNSMLIKVKPRSGDGDSGHTTLFEASDVLSSELWQKDKVRIVVYEGFTASALKRGLGEKLLQSTIANSPKLAFEEKK